MPEAKEKKEKASRKTVWPSAELYHVWAHQKAERGRASGQNVYFEGRTIYSYGSHFPMARLIVKDDKVVAVLITTRTYSSTTSQHQSSVSAAIRHVPRFYVTDVREGTKHSENLKDYKARIKLKAEEVTKAKATKEDKLRELAGLIAEANKYAEFFDLKTRLDYPDGFDRKGEQDKAVIETEKAEKRRKERDERDREKRAAQLAAAKLEYEKKKPEYDAAVAKWLAGEGGQFPALPIDPSWSWEVRRDMERENGTRLRVRGSRVETSLGAVFEVEAAKPLLALCRMTATGTLSRPEMEVSGYRGVTIDFDKRTVSVGCHTVKFAEAERIAKQLGL